MIDNLFNKRIIGEHILIYEDCFNVFPYIEDKSIYVIICDLPYGTTNLGVLKLGRKSIGFEKVKKYYDIAVSRLEKEINKLKV